MGVASLELFGSSVRGEAIETSDIDLLVSFDRPVGLFVLYEVEEYLEKLFPQKKIDLVLRRAVIPEFQNEVFAEAVPCLSGTGNSD
jgi:predicted nucleotidyltransferase